MNILLHQLRLGLKSLLNTPIFFISICLTIGITAGALSSVFNLSYLLLIKPLPYDNYSQLYVSHHSRISNGKEIGIGFQSYPALLDIYKSEEFFNESALIQTRRKKVEAGLLSVGNDRDTYFPVSFVTPEYFSFFSPRFKYGGEFTSDYRLNSFKPVAIVSYRFWQRHLNSVNDPVGRSILMGGKSFNIIGVLDRDFVEPKFDRTQKDSEIWLPFDFNTHDEKFRKDWTNFLPYNYLIGRISNTEDVNFIDDRIDDYLRDKFNDETRGVRYWSNFDLSHHMQALDIAITGDSKATALYLLIGILIIFFLAVGNVTNLFVTRAIQNKQRYSINVAMGATPKQLLLSILYETSVLISCAFIVAVISIDAVKSLILTYGKQLFPRLNELETSALTITFLLFTLLLLVVFFTVISMRSVNYENLTKHIQGGGKGVASTISKKVRNLMVIVQIAFAGLLLTASFEVVIRTIDNIKRPLGFDLSNTYTLSMETRAESLTGSERRNKMLQLKELISANQNVKIATVSNSTPLNYYLRRSVSLPDSEYQTRAYVANIDDKFFDTIGMPLVEGKTITKQEFNGKANVAVISSSLKRSIFGEGIAIGKTIVFGSNRKRYQIVGVVDDTAHPQRNFDSKVLFLPETRVPRDLIIKLYGDKVLTNTELEALVNTVDKRFSIYRYKSLLSIYEAITQNDYKLLIISIALVIIATVLTVIGIYGAVNYSIKLMKYEIGVYMAIGAKPIEITRKILGSNANSFAVGLLISTTLGGLIFVYITQFVSVISTISIWAPSIAFLVLTTSTALAIVKPVLDQIYTMPIIYLRN